MDRRKWHQCLSDCSVWPCVWSGNSFLVWGILNRFLGDWAMPTVTRAKRLILLRTLWAWLYLRPPTPLMSAAHHSFRNLWNRDGAPVVPSFGLWLKCISKGSQSAMPKRYERVWYWGPGQHPDQLGNKTAGWWVVHLAQLILGRNTLSDRRSPLWESAANWCGSRCCRPLRHWHWSHQSARSLSFRLEKILRTG